MFVRSEEPGAAQIATNSQETFFPGVGHWGEFHPIIQKMNAHHTKKRRIELTFLCAVKVNVFGLKQRLLEPLPGWRGQQCACPPGRPLDEAGVVRNAKKAGVMALLAPGLDGQPCLLLMQRTLDGSAHSGQLAFPGGAEEPADRGNMLTTAMREMEEEVGVTLEEGNVLGALSPLYIPPSRFLVYPFVAWLDALPKFRLQEEEVADVLMVPLSGFPRAGERWGSFPIRTPRGTMTVPGMPCGGQILWGATAMMISELLIVLEEANFVP